MKAEKGKTVVGFAGLGVMRQSMAGHILDAGYDLLVYNRTKEKAKNLIELGAVWKDDPRSLAEGSDVVITMVGYPADVEQVYLGERGLLQAPVPARFLST